MQEKITFTKDGRRLDRYQDRHFTSPGGGAWGAYETRLPHYMEDLNPLEEYDGEILDILRGSDFPVVVDVMASTGMLQDLHVRELQRKPGKFVAVGNHDNRFGFRKDRDDALGIKMVAGDIRDMSTWQRLRTELEGNDADLVISRALAGLYYVPTEGVFGYQALNEAYGLLKDYRPMLVQIPPASVLKNFGVPIDRWLEELVMQGVPFTHIPEYESITDFGNKYGLLRIDRIPGIPELPILGRKSRIIQNS